MQRPAELWKHPGWSRRRGGFPTTTLSVAWPEKKWHGILISWLYRHVLRPTDVKLNQIVINWLRPKKYHAFGILALLSRVGICEATVSCSWTVSWHRTFQKAGRKIITGESVGNDAKIGRFVFCRDPDSIGPLVWPYHQSPVYHSDSEGSALRTKLESFLLRSCPVVGTGSEQGTALHLGQNLSCREISELFWIYVYI